MSARNRELLALVPVAIIVTAGFAAVFIVKDNDVSDVSLTYGGYFLALCVAAHIFLRIRLPYADPYLFPLCALLAAVGLVVIYRIDDKLAFDQASVFVLGLVLFCLTILFLRDYHVLERYRYLIVIGGLLLLLLPRLPGIGESLLWAPGAKETVENTLIPQVQTDFIYALIVNELGLFGGCGVITI
ncbi:MAG: hypothetical protein ACHQJ5_08935, partial [Vicinamibacteria bacterium]